MIAKEGKRWRPARHLSDVFDLNVLAFNGFAVAMVACGPSKEEAAAKATADSIVVADSLAGVAAEAAAAAAVVQAKADSTAKADSVAAVAALPAKKK